jgi:hypothetical protein
LLAYNCAMTTNPNRPNPTQQGPPPASSRHVVRALVWLVVWAVATKILIGLQSKDSASNYNNYSNSGLKNPDLWWHIAIGAGLALLCWFLWWLGYLKDVNPAKHRLVRNILSVLLIFWGIKVVIDRHRLNNKPPMGSPNDYPGNTQWPN